MTRRRSGRGPRRRQLSPPGCAAVSSAKCALTLRQRRREPRADPHAVQPRRQLVRPLLERPLGVAAHILEQPHLDPALGVLTPAADDPAVPPCTRPPIAVCVEQLAAVLTEIPVPAVPAHRG